MSATQLIATKTLTHFLPPGSEPNTYVSGFWREPKDSPEPQPNVSKQDLPKEQHELAAATKEAAKEMSLLLISESKEDEPSMEPSFANAPPEARDLIYATLSDKNIHSPHPTIDKVRRTPGWLSSSLGVLCGSRKKPELVGILRPPKPVHDDSPKLQKGGIKKSAYLSAAELALLTCAGNKLCDSGDSLGAAYSYSRIEAVVCPPSSTFKPRIRVSFHPTTQIFGTYTLDEYDRSAISYAAKCLTPELVLSIKKELNETKADMLVHEASKHHTVFYKIK